MRTPLVSGLTSSSTSCRGWSWFLSTKEEPSGGLSEVLKSEKDLEKSVLRRTPLGSYVPNPKGFDVPALREVVSWRKHDLTISHHRTRSDLPYLVLRYFFGMRYAVPTSTNYRYSQTPLWNGRRMTVGAMADRVANSG